MGKSAKSKSKSKGNYDPSYPYLKEQAPIGKHRCVPNNFMKDRTFLIEVKQNKRGKWVAKLVSGSDVAKLSYGVIHDFYGLNGDIEGIGIELDYVGYNTDKVRINLGDVDLWINEKKCRQELIKLQNDLNKNKTKVNN